jgi:hypothetical protein
MKGGNVGAAANGVAVYGAAGQQQAGDGNVIAVNKPADMGGMSGGKRRSRMNFMMIPKMFMRMTRSRKHRRKSKKHHGKSMKNRK